MTRHWPKVSKDRPCPKCGHTNRCQLTEDGERGRCWRHKITWSVKGASREPLRPVKIRKPRPPRVYGSLESAWNAALLGMKRDDPSTRFVKCWTYMNHATGKPEMAVVRFDTSDGKECRPFHPFKSGWCIGDPKGLLPLYMPEPLPDDKWIFVHEGEKCADVGSSIGLPGVTASHGSGQAHRTDWTPLRNRRVCIVPDRDRVGEDHAAGIRRLLESLGCEVVVMKLGRSKLDTPRGYDMADFIEDEEIITSQRTRLKRELAAVDTFFDVPSDWWKKIRDAAKVASIFEMSDDQIRKSIDYIHRNFKPRKFVHIVNYPSEMNAPLHLPDGRIDERVCVFELT